MEKEAEGLFLHEIIVFLLMGKYQT